MKDTAQLRADLHRCTVDQPLRPDRAAALLAVHGARRRRRQRVVSASLAVAVACAGGVAVLRLPGDRPADTVATALVVPERDYLGWRFVDPELSPGEAELALRDVWRAWSGRAGEPDASVRPVVVTGSGFSPGVVVFQAVGPDGDLRLVHGAHTRFGGRQVVVSQDVPAPDPASVRFLCVVTQTDGPAGRRLDEPGELQPLSDAQGRATATAGSATSLDVFFAPQVRQPRVRFTAPGTTVADGIDSGVLPGRSYGFGLGTDGVGAVPADSVRVVVLDGDTVLYEGAPGLPER